MNWYKTNEELLLDYSAIDTSSIDDPKLKIEEKANSLTIIIQNIYKSIPEEKKEKPKARNRWKKTKDPQIKQHFNFLKRKLTKEIKQENEQNWEAFCDDMELDGQNNAWKERKKRSK